MVTTMMVMEILIGMLQIKRALNAKELGLGIGQKQRKGKNHLEKEN